MNKRAEKMLRMMDRAVTEWHIPVIGRETGRVIKRLLAKHAPTRGIEIGSLFGYSAILIAGGFLGLDNIGVFDRSRELPTGGHLAQADGTAWMAFYCLTMLSMALELASEDQAYEDVASKFFEHFVAIADAMNELGGTGLWDEGDGFYYDQLHVE